MIKGEKTFQEKTDEYAHNSIESIAGMVKKANSRNEERAEEGKTAIQENPLEIKTGKEFDGTRTYMILLGTGGPAARIIGELSEYDEPDSAEFQFQDWFEPWTTAQTTKEERETMIEYARHFYFEEVAGE